MIYEIKKYVDDEGKTLIERVPLNSDGEAGNPSLFSGMASVGTPQGHMPFEFEFPEDYTMAQCFENFEKVAEATLEEMQKAAQSQIVTPDDMGGIILP